MFTYTMTFVDQDELDIPSNMIMFSQQVKHIVLKKMEDREFTLADFNWSGNYDPENIKSYLKAPYRCNAVVEIRLMLNVASLSNRNAIYDECLTALKNDTVFLKYIKEFQNDQSRKTQQMIRFEMHQRLQ